MRVGFVAAVLVLFGGVGCSPDLGEAPFRCNDGDPACPVGYRCNAEKLCVSSSGCKSGEPGCESKCGDGICAAGKTCISCAKDCGPCTAQCGDGTCDAVAGEDCTSCAMDCGPCQGRCGDKVCDGPSEGCSSCPQDCGACLAQCGDGYCEKGESCSSCEKDCGVCAAGCGDGTCALPSEDCRTCELDCGSCPPRCGDGRCDPADETCKTCAVDCGSCTPSCGDGSCNGGEDCKSCALDCGACPACTAGQKRCQGSDTVQTCQSGRWVSLKCDHHCTTAGKDYTTGCAGGGCQCGDYREFGDLCSASRRCEPGLLCAEYGGKTYGFCTRACTSVGRACSGGNTWQWAECADKKIDNANVCLFWCDDEWSCPNDLVCSDTFLGGYCEPRK